MPVSIPLLLILIAILVVAFFVVWIRANAKADDGVSMPMKQRAVLIGYAAARHCSGLHVDLTQRGRLPGNGGTATTCGSSLTIAIPVSASKRGRSRRDCHSNAQSESIADGSTTSFVSRVSANEHKQPTDGVVDALRKEFQTGIESPVQCCRCTYRIHR